MKPVGSQGRIVGVLRQSAACVLVAALLLGSSNAMACRRPGYVPPTTVELASSSALVFIAHVGKVRPLSQAEEEFVASRFAGVPDGLPIEVPSERAEFSLVRNLKEAAPSSVLLKSSVWNCSGINLEQGNDYLVFAQVPDSVGQDISPIQGSFKLDGSEFAHAELQKIENHFILQAMKP